MEDQADDQPVYTERKAYLEFRGAYMRPKERLPSAPQFQVKFKFDYTLDESYWFINQDSSEQPRCLSSDCSTLIETCVIINSDQFLCSTKAHEIISTQLQSWPLSTQLRNELIDLALRKAHDGVRTNRQKHNYIRIRIGVDMVHEHYFDDRSVIDRIIQRSIEEAGPCTVPTVDSAIEALERKEISSDSGITCCICLEELGGCGVAVCMPCSHAFHGHCINKWLKTSHYCPVCRFEMPIS